MDPKRSLFGKFVSPSQHKALLFERWGARGDLRRFKGPSCVCPQEKGVWEQPDSLSRAEACVHQVV